MKISFASPSASIVTDTSRGIYFRIESASYLLPAVGKLRTETVRTNSLVAISVRIFSTGRDVLSRICNLRGTFKAFRSLLSSSLVHDANQPTRGFFHCFKVPKVLSFAALHVRNMQHRNDQDHGKSLHNHG